MVAYVGNAHIDADLSWDLGVPRLPDDQERATFLHDAGNGRGEVGEKDNVSIDEAQHVKAGASLSVGEDAIEEGRSTVVPYDRANVHGPECSSCLCHAFVVPVEDDLRIRMRTAPALDRVALDSSRPAHERLWDGEVRDHRRYRSLTAVQTLKDDVRDYWDAQPCGTTTVAVSPDSPEFFAEVEAARYLLEPYIAEFAEFARWTGQRVLEVGVGLGTDFVQFARAGAVLSGIDLTPAAVDAVRRRLRQESLTAQVELGDAEELPFPEGQFDLVYSYGVLHHTPDTERALLEVRRVLRPDGQARIMLYHRRSWLAFGGWVRWALLRGKPWRSISEVLAENLESPGTKAYTTAELEHMFTRAGFGSVRIVRHVTPYDRRVVGPVAGLTGDRLGWFAGVIARP